MAKYEPASTRLPALNRRIPLGGAVLLHANRRLGMPFIGTSKQLPPHEEGIDMTVILQHRPLNISVELKVQ